MRYDYELNSRRLKEQNEDEIKQCKKAKKIPPSKFTNWEIADLITVHFNKHIDFYSIYKIAMYLTDNNDFYADQLLDKYDIVELFKRYMYKLVLNYK